MSARRTWITAQIGAREHYAVPRVLHREERLEQLYTDVWCAWGRSVLRAAPDPLRSVANRFHPEIPTSKVHSFTGRALYHRLHEFLLVSDSDARRFQHHIDVGADFAAQVRDDLRRSVDDWHRRVFFGYDTGSLEVLDFLADTPCVTLVDQIDPGRTEKEIVLEEIESWPGWARQAPVMYEPYQERRAKEWDLASVVVVNSEWSKQALVGQGVPADKISVIPLAYEPPSTVESVRPPTTDPLDVLWLGSVILRKGIQYLVEAARLLRDEPIRFHVVGPIGITDEAVQSSPENMQFRGRVPRDQTAELYRDADVFVLPTLSDGFAITQLEAMAHGCPVIATRNCGRVVTPEEDGLLVPPRDPEALATAVLRCVQEQDLLSAMSSRAQHMAQRFTLDAYVDRLFSVVEQHAGT